MNEIKPTKKMIDGLRWFKQNEPVSLFPCDGMAPTNIIRKRLKTIGWIEECGKEYSRGPFAFTKFRVSDSGNDILNKESA